MAELVFVTVFNLYMCIKNNKMPEIWKN